MPRPCRNAKPDDLNDWIRNELGPDLTPKDKQEIADRMGVSYRTVNRWTTSAGEQRNPFPRRLPSTDPTNWPGRYRQRGDWFSYAKDGYRDAATGGREGLKTAKIRYKSIGEAVKDLRRWGKTGDPWLDEKIRKGELKKDAQGWYVQVTYVTHYLTGSEEPPDDPMCDDLDDDGADDGEDSE